MTKNEMIERCEIRLRFVEQDLTVLKARHKLRKLNILHTIC